MSTCDVIRRSTMEVYRARTSLSGELAAAPVADLAQPLFDEGRLREKMME